MYLGKTISNKFFFFLTIMYSYNEYVMKLLKQKYFSKFEKIVIVMSGDWITMYLSAT